MYSFYVTNTITVFLENLVVASLVEEMTVLYGEPFSIPYTVASSSNGTDNVLNETIELFIEFENSMTIEPTNLGLDLLSVVSGNYYQLTIPSANVTTTGNYRLIAEGMYLHIRIRNFGTYNFQLLVESCLLRLLFLSELFVSQEFSIFTAAYMTMYL